MSDGLLLITASRCKCFRRCPRLEWYEYHLGIRPLQTALALRWGTAWHYGLEVWWANGGSVGAMALAEVGMLMKARELMLDEYACTTLRVMLAAYHARWCEDMANYEVLGVETEFRAPLSDGFTLGGKLDVVIRKRSDGSVWLVEHKSSGEDISVGSDYWLRLRMDAQASIYFDGALVLGHEIDGIIYDVCGKPDVQPKRATPTDKRKYTQAGKLYANQRGDDESLAEFEGRITDEVAGDWDGHFQRREVVRLQSELEEARRDTIATARLMRVVRETGYAPRSVDSCQQYGRTCAYHSVCSGAADINDPTRFQYVGAHPELSTTKE